MRNAHLKLSTAAAAALGSIGLLAAVGPATARAEQFTYTNTSGNLSDPNQYAEGRAPTGGGVRDTITFGGGDPAYTVTNDYDRTRIPAFYFERLTFATTSPGSRLVATGTGTAAFPNQLSLRATTTTASIDQTGAGGFSLVNPISIAEGANLSVNVAAGAGQLVLANLESPTTAAANNVIRGDGDITFTNNSTNPILVGNLTGLTGDLTVLAGEVRVADGNTTETMTVNPDGTVARGTGAGDILRESTLVTVAAGATFDFNDNGDTMGGLSGAGTFVLRGNSGIGLNFTSDLTVSGRILGLPDSAGVLGAGITKDVGSGATTYTFEGDNTYTGTTTVNAGTFRLSGGGRLSSTAVIDVNNGARLLLDNTAQNVADRLNPAARLDLEGTLSIRSAGDAAAAQTLASISIGTTVVPSNGIPVFSITGASVLDLDAGASLSAGSLTGVPTRGATLAIPAGTVSDPEPVEQINGIIPFATRGNDWATQPGNTGAIVAFNAYQTSNDPAAFSDTDNVKITGPLTGPVAASRTLNSLNFASDQTLTIGAGQTLSLAAGGILSSAGGTITGGTIVGAQAANAEILAVVNGAANTLTINSAIGNAPVNGLTKSGDGRLVLGGTSTYAGGTRIFGGTVEVSSDANLGAAAGGIVLSNSTLRVTAGGFSSGRVLTVNGTNNVIDTGANDVTFTATSGVRLNGRGTLTKTGTGMLNFAGAGGRVADADVVVAEGMFRTGVGNTLDSDTFVTINAGAVLDLSFDTSAEDFEGIAGAGEVRVVSSGINVGGGRFESVEFSGKITPFSQGAPAELAGGRLGKRGLGNLTLSGTQSDYTGETNIDTGTVTVTADVLPDQPGPMGKSVQIVTLSTAADNNVNAAGLLLGASGIKFGRDVIIFGTGAGTGVVTIGTTYTSGTSTFSGPILTDRPFELSIAEGGRLDLTGEIAGSGTATGGLVKVGGGVANFAGSGNAYSGDTYVGAGTLLANNTSVAASATSAGRVFVTDGATLGGAGRVGGATQVRRGASVAPGSTGAGTTGDITLAGGLELLDGSVLLLDLGTADSDSLLVTGGTFTGAGTGGVSVRVSDAGGLAPGQSYTLIDWTGATATGVEAQDFVLMTDASSEDVSGTFSIEGSTLRLSTTPVPEPGVIGLLLPGLALLARRRRRAR